MMENGEKQIILFGHAGCAMVGPVKRLLEEINAPFDYVNIHQDMDGRLRVREINRGFESVPTLVFPDGSTLTEPSSRVLSAKLKELGYVKEDGSDPKMGAMGTIASNPLLVIVLIWVIILALIGVAMVAGL